MPLIQWRDSFKTGSPSIDFEHQKLIGLINSLHDRLEEAGSEVSVSAFFGDLYAEISSHFALEEAVMRERRYAGYAEHKADHEALLDQIRDIMDDYESGTYKNYRDKLTGQLNAWFTRHFQTLDARLHGFLGAERRS